MDFVLRYRGPLAANGSVKEKHDIRRAFHPQLLELCSQESSFRPATSGLDVLPRGVLRGRVVEVPRPLQASFYIVELGGFHFVPLIHRPLELACALDILFLRRERPGAILSGGDLDNRLKTLFDALRMPHDLDELRGVTPGAPDERVYCLLEDDALITRVSVSTQQLLEPLAPSEAPTTVELLIHVTALPVAVVHEDATRARSRRVDDHPERLDVNRLGALVDAVGAEHEVLTPRRGLLAVDDRGGDLPAKALREDAREVATQQDVPPGAGPKAGEFRSLLWREVDPARIHRPRFASTALSLSRIASRTHTRHTRRPRIFTTGPACGCPAGHVSIFRDFFIRFAFSRDGSVARWALVRLLRYDPTVLRIFAVQLLPLVLALLGAIVGVGLALLLGADTRPWLWWVTIGVPSGLAFSAILYLIVDGRRFERRVRELGAVIRDEIDHASAIEYRSRDGQFTAEELYREIETWRNRVDGFLRAQLPETGADIRFRTGTGQVLMGPRGYEHTRLTDLRANLLAVLDNLPSYVRRS
jgi:hypothetical protein